MNFSTQQRVEQDAKQVNAVLVNKILGIHPQKQEGLYMQRIKIFAGQITWRQWRKIAELAAQYSPDTPIHLTTRQDIELHNIGGEQLQEVQRGLAEEGISVFAAGGDSIRNITVSPESEFEEGGYNLLPLAQLVRQYLEQHPVAFSLYRKFKLSFSSSERATAKPWISDLGFIAQSDGRFTVTGAGSLGAKPALGIELYRNLPASDVLPLCVAAVEFFAEHGERENRRKARFRHVREKFGDEEFKDELERRFAVLKSASSWPNISLAQVVKGKKLLARLQPANGNITAERAIGLADAAEASGAVGRINLEHGIELYGDDAVQLPNELAAFADNPVIVTCPGATTCKWGLVNGWETADEIRRTLAGQDPGDVRIYISGCPNNCAHSTVADIGLVGTLRKKDGKLVEHFKFFVGGGNGRENKPSMACGIIPAENVPVRIKQLLQEHKFEHY